MRITLRQLQVFDAVARQGTVTRAADVVALSQSAAIMSLSDLEHNLGTVLFNRRGKRLQLNDYGRWLLPRVHQVLQMLSEIEESAHAEGLCGQLKIGASSTIGNYLVPGLIADFVDEHPQVEIKLSVGNTEQVVDDMLNLNIDLGLIEGPCHSQQLAVSNWRTDSLKIFCSPQHPLSKKRRISLNQLSKESWILREPGSGTREIFALATRGKIEPLNIKLELGNSEAVKQAVKKGFSLGCLSELAIASELSMGS